ncbi:MAG: RecB-family nuclease [Candidatus Nezhaarchaeota archaeon]|nr:RecB-family nuclease [Candidatus Nezhaarchaeota archaeon]
MLRDRLAVILHGAHGVEIVKQMAKLTYGLGFNLFILSKPTSAAAQLAVPEVSKLAFKKGKGFLVVPDIVDVLELLSPVKALFFVEGTRGEMFSEDEVVEALKDGHVALFFSAVEPGFSLREMEKGRVVCFKLPDEIGCIAMAAITLFKVWNKLAIVNNRRALP